MPINAGYEYFNAEKKYLAAQTLDERIIALRELIKAAPKHKSSENLLAELKTRLKKFLEKSEKSASVGKGKKGIRKEGFQVILVGLSNSGKSMLLSRLTNALPVVSSSPYTTRLPNVGTMNYEGVYVQVVDLPAILGKDFDMSILHTADLVLTVLEKIEDLKLFEKVLEHCRGKRLIVINKVDLLDSDSIRKLDARLKSNKLDFVLISALKNIGIDILKNKILLSMDIIRVFTKEPGKQPSKQPIVLSEKRTVKDAAESIYKGFSKIIVETKLTGPSGKFANQRVGLSHVLKDRDVLEFKTR
ncbi:MAG: GTPase [Nanoarchaeota archaeon]